MSKSFARLWALPLILSVTTGSADITTKTDLASIVVIPLTRQPNVTADWQTIYNYQGGNVLPPGTRIIANAKWIEPTVRKDDSGVTFGFPNLPDQPTAGQFLEIGFVDELPIANYPTRTTLQYTSYHDQTTQTNWWSPFLLTTGDLNYQTLSGAIRPVGDPNGGGTTMLHPVGLNTLVFSFDGKGSANINLNKYDAPFLKNSDTAVSKGVPEPGAMLMPGIAIRNVLTQTPNFKGDWFTVHNFKVEQLRPPLEVSAVAEVHLTVPGSDAIRVTIEIVDDKNASRGYLLRDALVSPGRYRLYWDGIDQKQGMMKNTAWISAGAYTFHLTTSKTVASFAGESDNSTPKYNANMYGLVNCTALALTPPGTLPSVETRSLNFFNDTRKFDATDSVQLTGISYDARYGNWIGADGSVIHTKMGSGLMQYGRAVAMTPPDPADPTNPAKQFLFGSVSIARGDSVVSTALPPTQNVSKKLTSPDWNRPPATFLPYKIHIGRVPDMLGAQHYLFFLNNTWNEGGVPPGQQLHAEWIFRNIRFYEEGTRDPGPSVTFDKSKFAPRIPPRIQPPPTLDPGTVTVEDNGHTVHLKNAIPLNYPLEYTVTSHTIMAFDLDVVDRSAIGMYNGIGVSPDPYVDNDKSDSPRSFNFLNEGDPRMGFTDSSIGAYAYPSYDANTLYTDTVPINPRGAPPTVYTALLWEPGFYGLKVGDDGKLLFACNNSDNRLEVRDISKDGGAIAKIPINYPMFVTWAPDGENGAPHGTRYVYVDSPNEGILRIAWNTADNTFGKPMRLTPAAKFAYPRGITYDAVSKRLFVCDTFNMDRSKVANQIVVIDPVNGRVISRFGEKTGFDPSIGGNIDDKTFSCPLTIASDSKGAIWVNDFYTCEVRKYAYNPKANSFTLERRVLGPSATNNSHFYWMPGDPPTRGWAVAGFFVRYDSDIDAGGRFTNQRATSATFVPGDDNLRPYAHFMKVGTKVYGTFINHIYEQVGDGWAYRFNFGNGAGDAARNAGLLARPGQPPTELDKAIAASGDKVWESRSWAWSDLNGDGKMEYTNANPEFQIAFNSKIAFNDSVPASSCLRADGAFVKTAVGGLLVFTQTQFNGKPYYTWANAKIVPMDETASDVLAQDGRYYVLACSTQRHDMGGDVISHVKCFDETGKLLWTREQNAVTLLSLQPLGNGMISILDRGGWNSEGPVTIRTSDGDLVSQIYCQEAGDCWSHGALRSDPDTAYISLVQAYKVTGLSTAKTATVTATLPAGSN